MCLDNGIELDHAAKYSKAQLSTLMTSSELSDNDETQTDKGEELDNPAEAELPVKTTPLRKGRRRTVTRNSRIQRLS